MDSKRLGLIKNFATWFRSQTTIGKMFVFAVVILATVIYDFSPFDLLPGIPLDDIAVTGLTGYTLYQMFFGK